LSENYIRMKYSLKPCFLFLCAAFFCCMPIGAQDVPAVNYLQQVGDYAEIYNGKLEETYNVLKYENLPYYKDNSFTDASVVYKNKFYPNQKARIDLFREQLILLMPEKRYGVILSSQNLQEATIHNKTFVWLNPASDSGLKQGYYIRLFEDKTLKLFCKESYGIQQNQVTYYFERKIRYHLFYNGRYYQVKNKGSYTKLFPKLKKQINQFAKNHKLNFKNDAADNSLSLLTGYCEELLTSTNKQ